MVDIAILHEVFEVDSDKVYWRKRPVNHFSTESSWKRFNTMYAGKEIKPIGPTPGVTFRIKGTRYTIQLVEIVLRLEVGDINTSVSLFNRIETFRSIILAELYLDNGIVRRKKNGKTVAVNRSNNTYFVSGKNYTTSAVKHILEGSR